MNEASLLIEFLCEELPPLELQNLISKEFAERIFLELKSFVSHKSNVTIIATPRRFGCLITNVLAQELSTITLRKGPTIKGSINDVGEISKALLGFMQAHNINNVSELVQKDGYFFAEVSQEPVSLSHILSKKLPLVLQSLPVTKRMRWGSNDFYFSRPLHNLLIIHGVKPIQLTNSCFGLYSVDYTFGHRILSKKPIVISNADSYVNDMKSIGKVIVDNDLRKNLILTQLESKANELGYSLHVNSALLDEVTALVEYPVVLQGSFDSSFLDVPPECLILSMAKNQKYFALVNNKQQLVNKFLFVANLVSENPAIIIAGNQKVLAARLTDARFFYLVDKKFGLQHYATKLSQVLYYHLLGTLQDRVTRIEEIAIQITQFGIFKSFINLQDISLLVKLMKADLMTQMVDEFPELQGTMGKYYAIDSNHSIEIATAIEEHYYPRFSNDKLPSTPLSIIVALADKIETLVGIWGVGLIPTGDKDPYALRRNALGIIRILLQYKINIIDLIDIAFAAFLKFNFSENIKNQIYSFIMQRLSNYLLTYDQEKYDITLIKAVCSCSPQYFVHIFSLLTKLHEFKQNDIGRKLFAINKRIDNILKKNNKSERNEINVNLFQDSTEKVLYDLLIKCLNNEKLNAMDWDYYFDILKEFCTPIEDFFANVMVMDSNLEVRQNRLNLLNAISLLMNKYCNLVELS